MRVLLLGDASHYHATLAVGLRRLGHDVTVASAGSGWMDTPRDIDLSRRSGKLGGALLWLRLNSSLWHRLKGYDVVQIVGPVFIDQRPNRVAQFFRRLKRNNGAVMLTALATDRAFIDMCMAADSPMPYSEWSNQALRTTIDAWHAPALSALCDEIYASVDGCLSALWEYHEAMLRVMPAEKLAYAGIPIDTAACQPAPRNNDSPMRIFLGRHSHRMDIKGTDFLENVAREVVARAQGKAVLDIVEDLPYREYIRRLRDADVVLDQIYSPTPATNALLAMAHEQVAVSGAEPQFYDFIGEHTLRPIINARPDDPEGLKDKLLSLTDADLRRRLGDEGRLFVEKHNDVDVVARRFHDFWIKTLNRL